MWSDSKLQIALEFGFTELVASYAISKHDFATAGDLVDYLDLHEEELERLAKEEELERRVKEKEVCDQQQQQQQQQTLTLREETEFLLRRSLCRVCVKEKPSIVTLPCGHFYLCSQCEKTCQYCPDPDCNMIIEVAMNTILI